MNIKIMKNTYIGSVEMKQEDTPFKGYSAIEFAMCFIESYGQIDGGHHKQWVIDQVARILKGTPIMIEKATWTDHEPEWRLETGEPSKRYLDWVTDMRGNFDEKNDEYEYGYDEGIAP